MKTKKLLAALCAAMLPAAASAALLVQESFPASQYSTSDLTTNPRTNPLTTDNARGQGGDGTGFTAGAPWVSGSTVAAVFADGLEIPSGWGAEYASGGRSIGFKFDSAPAATHYRTFRRATSAVPASGTFFFRVLMRQDSGVGAATPASAKRGVGLMTASHWNSVKGTGNYGPQNGSGVFEQGLWFAFRKTSGGTELVLFGGGSETTVVESVVEDEIYVCFAKVDLDNGSASAAAMPVGEYRYAEPWSDANTVSSVSATPSDPFVWVAMSGLYTTGSSTARFVADEFAIGETFEDVAPVTSFAVSGSVSVNGTVATYAASIVTNAPESVASVAVSVKRGTGATALLNSSDMADNGDGTFVCDVSPLSYGTTYYYAFDAVATMTDGSTTVVHGATNSFNTFVAGPIYVKEGNSGTAPYDALENAAPTIAEAFRIAADGATVRIADGSYTISERIALDGGETVESVSGDPSKVVISLPGETAPGRTTRFFNLYDGATLAGVTLSGGNVLNGNGGNVWMRGGLLTNCVIRGGTCTWNGSSGGESSGGNLYAQRGRIVDCVITGGRAVGGNENHSSAGRAGAFYGAAVESGHSGQVQNCLFVDNGGDSANWVASIDQSWVVESCTFVSSSLGFANTAGSTGAAALRIADPSARVRNCAFAGITDSEGATALPLAGNAASVSFCAFDIAAADAGADLGEGCVFSALPRMFASAGGNPWLPGDALRDKGSAAIASANLPATDLSGARARVVGRTIDIGCYEYTPEATVFILR